ncbi:hypothetical protein ACFOOK_13975 [Micromonospora krabiensis]|uniref:Uncharacterized protein n=1 Tax=Micromonospora krabiensis TaxID=307121 RepID=A0A1C3N1K9_9ACTN|nr:hypothetical protein [Micromonospora krabiensis]SBV26456.1 hypothetical protein GA0070620_1945 [Micromonospora krabiensis]
MDPVPGDRPWQRPDRTDPLLPGPGQGPGALALLCALLAPASWSAVACTVAWAIDGSTVAGGSPRLPDVVGVLATASVAVPISGVLLVLLRRRPGLRRPAGALAAVAAVLAAPALPLTWPG